MKTLLKILVAAAFVVAIQATASAQFAATIQGPYLNGTPAAPYGSQLFQYNCTNATPTSGNCAPVVQVGNAAPLGPQTPAASIGVVLTATQITTDPCTLGGGVGGAVSKLPFNISGTATTIQLVAPVAAMQVYLCTLDVNVVAASTVNLTAGTGATCTTGTPTTLAGPMSFPALALWMRGTGGATVYRTLTAGHGVCVSASTGVITASGTYVQQ